MARRSFGSIRIRENGKYQAYYFDLSGKRRSAGVFRSKSDTSAALSAIETELKRGTWRDPDTSRERFADYARRWLSWREHSLAPRTFNQYNSLFSCHLEPTFGKLPLNRIDTPLIRSWNAAMKGAKPGAAVSAYRLLRAILNTAVDDDVLPRNPCRVKGAGSDRSPERVPRRWRKSRP